MLTSRARARTAPPMPITLHNASARRAHLQRRRPVPDPCTYDYAIVRVVPRVERGEFVNVGAIVSSDAKGYLGARFAVDEVRLLGIDPHVDLSAVRTALAAIAAVCAGGAAAGAIGRLSLR